MNLLKLVLSFILIVVYTLTSMILNIGLANVIFIQFGRTVESVLMVVPLLVNYVVISRIIHERLQSWCRKVA